jgi:hypothetical protein
VRSVSAVVPPDFARALEGRQPSVPQAAPTPGATPSSPSPAPRRRRRR